MVRYEPTLRGVTFNFTFGYTVNGTSVEGIAALTPGTCSALSAPIPVVAPNGDAYNIEVSEAATPTVTVSNIAVQNGTLVFSNTSIGAAVFNIKPGHLDDHLHQRA